MTITARPILSARACAGNRARLTGTERRIIALRAAIADGSYRIDPQAIAAKLLATVRFSSQLSETHH